jgi:hypothetical protein
MAACNFRADLSLTSLADLVLPSVLLAPAAVDAEGVFVAPVGESADAAGRVVAIFLFFSRCNASSLSFSSADFVYLSCFFTVFTAELEATAANAEELIPNDSITFTEPPPEIHTRRRLAPSSANS